MGSLSIWHWLIVLAVVLVLFGGGNKISTLMGDVARGMKSFKKNMAEDEPAEGAAAGPTGHIAPPNPAAGAQRDASFSGSGHSSGTP
ncbi:MULTISPECIES: twin-arginine translocase TatA/TatE family subunit [Nguyenibacter]|uniref:Sec-independent protein translocase protein TatA n=1 Tax=Nguyenibacter vanlangensis TaxID=1216886 RepID=A0A7Y7M809_9PROT|nr:MULTISPECIES: twin-arginine translocase TatA/TatE family subunit [Nguyenibacter]NVN12519.1 twin-arginine translocase TatA/TatE family subunit [Nguyenibacter vanlangensis]WRH87202.1 twin-arginine translocase TatA/TatE family subunit [Nguyenibacter sp. L1]